MGIGNGVIIIVLGFVVIVGRHSAVDGLRGPRAQDTHCHIHLDDGDGVAVDDDDVGDDDDDEIELLVGKGIGAR